MEHKLNEAMAHGSLYENAAKSIAPEIFGHQDVPTQNAEFMGENRTVAYYNYIYTQLYMVKTIYNNGENR